jgi:hypothetical protein
MLKKSAFRPFTINEALSTLGMENFISHKDPSKTSVELLYLKLYASLLIINQNMGMVEEFVRKATEIPSSTGKAVPYYVSHSDIFMKNLLRARDILEPFFDKNDMLLASGNDYYPGRMVIADSPLRILKEQGKLLIKAKIENSGGFEINGEFYSKMPIFQGYETKVTTEGLAGYQPHKGSMSKGPIFLGYRGTTYDRAEDLINNGKFKEDDDSQWGAGIYLTPDIKLASYFAADYEGDQFENQNAKDGVILSV